MKFRLASAAPSRILGFRSGPRKMLRRCGGNGQRPDWRLAMRCKPIVVMPCRTKPGCTIRTVTSGRRSSYSKTTCRKHPPAVRATLRGRESLRKRRRTLPEMQLWLEAESQERFDKRGSLMVERTLWSKAQADFRVSLIWDNGGVMVNES